MENITPIKQPYDDWSAAKKKEIVEYYPCEISWEKAITHLYGGKALSGFVTKLKIDTTDTFNRIVTITLYSTFGETQICNLSFKQLLVESSYRYGDRANNHIGDWQNDGWTKINYQQRLEICQNELSRWSVVIIDVNKKEWPNGIPDSIKVKNGSWIQRLEIINNCTTSKGFELKIRFEDEDYHGSFQIPQKVYRTLCEVQAGAWASQGWGYPNNDSYSPEEGTPGLLSSEKKPDKINNPTFDHIYNSHENANENVLIDLEEYRMMVLGSAKEFTPVVNRGEINYKRWGGKKEEYFQKPKVRGLVTDLKKIKSIDPPITYGQVINPESKNGIFRLPKFGEDGLYNVREPVPKNKYHQLNLVEKVVIIQSTYKGLVEIEIRFAISEYKTDLHKIIIGNINLESNEITNNFLTIDRFCFNPRKTVSHYNDEWLPAAEKFGSEKKAVYAFLLGAERSYENKYGSFKGHVFIQPESWGLERAILKREGDLLTIDLISYERIVPVWQGTINLREFDLLQ